MRHLKDNRGFTLVELIVSIASATVVLGATSMLLLMCVRTQRDVLDAARGQQTARTVIAMMENLASDGTIQSIETKTTGWSLNGDTDLLVYDATKGTLSTNGSVLVEGVNTAHATLNGQIFDFSFETALGSYSTSVYCRLLTPANEDTSVDEGELAVGDISSILNTGKKEPAVGDKRAAFIQTLLKEYGSTGMISGGGGSYAKWYESSWADNTPWCACYLSWAIEETLGAGNGPRFANVNTGWQEWKEEDRKDRSYTPIPGDYIFFDWEAATGGYDSQGPKTPDHVGAVLYVADDIVYTIEGNSGNRVAIRSYSVYDPRILGYGVLSW